MDIFHVDPAVLDLERGVYLPFSSEQPWGVFHQNGRIVGSTVDYREGIHAPAGQPERLSQIGDVRPETTLENLYYGGRLHRHYGHFLINTLPRYWALQKHRPAGSKILVHGDGRLDDWFHIPHVAETFGTLGLGRQDFVLPTGPVLLHRLRVAETSLEEQAAGYRVYADMCRAIGQRILSRYPAEEINRPIYLSKTGMVTGVHKIVNEHELDSALSRHGVDIINTNTFATFSEQVRLLASRPLILGTAGSFLHTSIFCEPRTIVSLSSTPLNSNYRIVDALTGSRAHYYHPKTAYEVPSDGHILRSLYLHEVEAVAAEYVELARSLCA